MTTDTPQNDDHVDTPPSAQRIDLATRRVYTNHMFTIQPAVRDRYGLESGDKADIYGLTVDGRRFEVNNQTITDDWMLYLGRGVATEYGLADGGFAEITLVVE